MITRKVVTVYKGRNSPVPIGISLRGALIDFTVEVNKMGVVIDGVEYTSTDGFIEYSVDGEVIFKLGSIPTPPTKRVLGRLVIYTNKYPLGYPIITEKTDHQLLFEFV